MLKKYAKEQPKRYYDSFWWFGKVMYANSAVDMVEEAAFTEDSLSFETIESSSTDYSTTNVQKVWVDEPEIIKTDGKYFYYYNSKTSKISIVQSPLDIDEATLDPNKVKIVKEIAIPQGLSNVELFINNDRLVLMWNYYSPSWSRSDLFNGNRTILAIYDVSDIDKLNLVKFENLPWYYENSRLIDNQLYERFGGDIHNLLKTWGTYSYGGY